MMTARIESEWVTLAQAAAIDLVPVGSETLRRMINRGDVPAGRWQEKPFGNRIIYYIDKHVLPFLKYRQSGQRGKGKVNNL